MVKVNARELRKSMTDAEKILWKHLRLKQLHNYKFRRQSPIGSYIADFVCFEKKLVIELDGSQHMNQTAYDSERTKWFERQGFQILRFWNNDVLTQTQTVVESIFNTLTPHLDPPPQGGRSSEI